MTLPPPLPPPAEIPHAGNHEAECREGASVIRAEAQVSIIVAGVKIAGGES